MLIHPSSLSPQMSHPASPSLWYLSIHFLSSFFSQAVTSRLPSSQTPPVSLLLLLPAQLHCSPADIHLIHSPILVHFPHILSASAIPTFKATFSPLCSQTFISWRHPQRSALVPLYSCTAGEQTFGQETM